MFPEFIWNPAKARANWRKHGVSFEEAAEAFRDTNSVSGIDGDLDYGEPRYIHLGRSRGHLLKVIYVERGDTVRIISARKATRYEQESYFTGFL